MLVTVISLRGSYAHANVVVVWIKSVYSTLQHISMAANLEVLWAAPPGGPATFSCIECGLLTGNFCDGSPSVGYDKCFAVNRVPQEYTFEAGHGGLRTPLCTYCETRFEFCRCCRGVGGCTPPTRHNHWSGVPMSESRYFNETQAGLATLKEFEIRKRVAAMEQTKTAIVISADAHHAVNARTTWRR